MYFCSCSVVSFEAIASSSGGGEEEEEEEEEEEGIIENRKVELTPPGATIISVAIPRQ